MTETETTTTPPEPVPEPEGQGGGVMRVVYIAFGVLLGLFLLVLGLAVWAAAAGVEQFGPAIRIVRDLMIIILALEGILIIFALVVLIAQIARLVNLLQNEINPVLENTRETVNHAKGTVEFVGKNITEPVVTANKFLAGFAVFTREVFRVRRALRRDTPVEDGAKEDDNADADKQPS